jgi:hypothetical protein
MLVVLAGRQQDGLWYACNMLQPAASILSMLALGIHPGQYACTSRLTTTADVEWLQIMKCKHTEHPTQYYCYPNPTQDMITAPLP